jgi:hypothetical protein
MCDIPAAVNGNKSDCYTFKRAKFVTSMKFKALSYLCKLKINSAIHQVKELVAAFTSCDLGAD